MVELIGLVTMSALVWVLHVSMANESDAERRRLTRLGTSPFAEMAESVEQERDAAGSRVAA